MSLVIDLHAHILPKNWADLKEKYGYGGFVQLRHNCQSDNDNCKSGDKSDKQSPHRSDKQSPHRSDKQSPHCSDKQSDYSDMYIDGKHFRKIHKNCFCSDTRIKECNESGVDIQVLSTVPIMFSYWAKPKDTYDLSKYLNDHIAQTVSENPKRFVGLGTLPMQSPELAIKELRRCVQDLGLKGIMIGSHIEDKNLDHPDLFPIFQEAEKLDACIFVHPWDMMGQNDMKDYWLPWLVGMPAETSRAICSLIFGGVFERLPNLRVAFAHGGGSFPMTIGRIEHGHNVRPDLCAVKNTVNPKSYLGKFWVDSLVHSDAILEYLVELLGENRVMLGTDYPFVLGETNPGKLIKNNKNLDDTTKSLLLGGNAVEFLKLDEKYYAE